MADDNNFVSFVCDSCHQELEAPPDMIGQSVECPSCGAHIVVKPPQEQQQETMTKAQAEAMKSRTIRIELGDI